MKNKILLSLVLCLALCLSLGTMAFASGIGYVSDAAGLLSAEDVENLNSQAAQISEYYGCGVYIVVVDDYRSYVNGSMQDFSEAVYKSYALGVGEGKDGIMLALSMAERDYDLCAYGDFAHYAFTDYGKSKLANEFLDNFRNNDWVGGFNDYLAYSISLMDLAKNGNPLDTIVYEEVPAPRGWDAFDLMIILVVSCLAGFAVCAVFQAQMKNTGRQKFAEDYLRFNFNQLHINSNQFLRRDVVRVPIRRDNDDDGFRPSGGRPGGTSINSGGFSHSGGKF